MFSGVPCVLEMKDGKRMVGESARLNVDKDAAEASLLFGLAILYEYPLG